jgi:hypothetical protein
MSMNTVRDICLTVIASFIFLFLVTVIRGLMALTETDLILALLKVVSSKTALYIVAYSVGVAGSLLSAAALIPLGWVVSRRPYLIGAIVGLSTELYVASTLFANPKWDVVTGIFFVEFVSLVVASSLATGFGWRLKTRRCA